MDQIFQNHIFQGKNDYLSYDDYSYLMNACYVSDRHCVNNHT